MPWVTQSRLNELQARADMYAENARGARAVQRTALSNAANIAAKFVELDNSVNRLERRLDRALRGCARYRNALRRSEKQTRGLQARLDQALGLNAPGVLNGAQWQERRHDKRKEYTA